MYIWNIFAVIGQTPHLLNPIIERVEKYEQIEQQKLSEPDQPLDDYCRCLLLKGMCLRHLQQHSQVTNNLSFMTNHSTNHSVFSLFSRTNVF